MDKKRMLSLASAAAVCIMVFSGCGDTVNESGAADGAVSDAEQSAGAAAGEEAKPAGVMRGLSASEYAVDMGVGINLGNTFEAYWEDKSNTYTGAQTIGENTPLNYETCWGAVETTKECIDGMSEAGFSTVRIPVYWGNMMEADGEYVISSEYIGRVQEVVDQVIDDGMYAVVNIHHYDEFLFKNKPKAEALEISEKLWTQIAEYFRDYPDQLVFEGFNENVGTHLNKEKMTPLEVYDYVNEISQSFVDTVRKTGGNNSDRLLIISGYNTNIDKTTDPHFVMPTDIAEDKLMVSVHYIDNGNYWANTIGGDAWREYSTAQCELLKNAFTDKGIPVFVGECTSIYEAEHFAEDADVTDSSECLKYILDMAADYGFVPVLWDVNDNFYSRTDCKIKSESDAEVIKEVAGKIKGA